MLGLTLHLQGNTRLSQECYKSDNIIQILTRNKARYCWIGANIKEEHKESLYYKKKRKELYNTCYKELGYILREKKDLLLKQILRECYKFLNIFKKETGIKALLKHSLQDHEIPLEEGKEPPFSHIYQILEANLRILREYINENLKKGFIRLLNSLAGSLVLFLPKKDKKKRLYVNY